MCRTAGKSSARSERSRTVEASWSFTSRTPAISRFRSKRWNRFIRVRSFSAASSWNRAFGGLLATHTTPRNQVYRRLQPYRETEMNSDRARQIVLAALPNGRPSLTDFRLEEAVLPMPGFGQILLRVQYLSLDPYMRGRMNDRKSYAEPLQLGDVMIGQAVAQVIASNRPGYSVGDIVLAQTGWRSHALSDGTGLRKLDPATAPVTTALGVLGMPGFTAYGGLRVIGKPQPGETVVVAAASGPVGSLVGQLAKLAGARAVGIAGGPQKCAFVKDELRFDAAVDHRAPDFPARLAAACPQGIDVYFENVGGAIWQAVLPLLNDFARVPVSGLIAQYHGTGPGDGVDRLPATMRQVLSKSLTLRGFIYYHFAEQYYPEFLREVGAGIADGGIHYREDIVDGLENAPEAFIGMLDGRNFGKLIVRVAVGIA